MVHFYRASTLVILCTINKAAVSPNANSKICPAPVNLIKQNNCAKQNVVQKDYLRNEERHFIYSVRTEQGGDDGSFNLRNILC